MPKNPWTYKRRKKRKRTRSTENGELIENSRMPNPSKPEIHIGTIHSEIIVSPFKQLKKEFIYPDTRFLSSTTLFPAMEDKKLQSETPSKTFRCVLKEEKRDLDQKVEHAELYRVPYHDNSISREGMSEISRLNNCPMTNEDTINPDKGFQSSTTIFPAQDIENTVPSGKPNKSFKPKHEVRTKCVMREGEYSDHNQMPNPDNMAISISVMSEIPLPNDTPIKYEDIIYPDKGFQCVSPHFLVQEIKKIIPSKKSNEILKHDPENALETPSNEAKLSVSDDCVIIENSNPQVDLIDLTGNSYEIISQFITLD